MTNTMYDKPTIGDLVRIKDGAHRGVLGLVMFMPLKNVARVKILDQWIIQHDYVSYNIDSLEKL